MAARKSKKEQRALAEAVAVEAPEVKVMRLPVRLTPEELLEAGRRLAEQMALRKRLELDLAGFKKQVGADIERAEAEMAKQGEMVSSATEYREVECEVRRDWQRGTKAIVRKDTGELVREEAIPELERQQRLQGMQ